MGGPKGYGDPYKPEPAMLSRVTVRRKWREFQWWVTGTLWIVALVLGYVGFDRYYAATGGTQPFWTIAYQTLQLFVLESGTVSGPTGWALGVARFFAPGVALFTVIQAAAAVFYEQLRRIGLRFAGDHVVVCGLGRKGLMVTREFCRLGHRVVVIERDEGNDYAEQCKDLGAVLITGDASDPDLLRIAQASKARYVISVCGDDGVNAEVALEVRNLAMGRRGKTVLCLAHIVDPRLCDLLRERGFYLVETRGFRLELFNIFESGARVLLDECPPFGGTPDGGQAARPHVLVVGLGRFGESLVLHAARQWSSMYPSLDRRPHFSIVDRDAENKLESLCLRHRQLVSICRFNSLQMEVESPLFERAEFLHDDEEAGEVTAVYVCLDDDSRGLSAALALLNRLRGRDVPIVVRMGGEAGLASLLAAGDGEAGGFANLHAFALLDRTCRPEVLLCGVTEILARAIHEDYVCNRRKEGDTPRSNPSMVPWQELPDNLRESNRAQADGMVVKLGAAGYRIVPVTGWDAEEVEFTPDEVELMARMEHERWMEERLAGGWTYAAGEKDLQRKKSPYLVPWDDLTEEIRERDREAVRGIPALLARAGFGVCRPPRTGRPSRTGPSQTGSGLES